MLLPNRTIWNYFLLKIDRYRKWLVNHETFKLFLYITKFSDDPFFKKLNGIVIPESKTIYFTNSVNWEKKSRVFFLIY